MSTPLYDQVHQLVIDIANASESDLTRLEWQAYNNLHQLCKDNEFSEHNHPFQWEALADVTNDNIKAISLYEKAYLFAQQQDLPEYSASIKLELARLETDEQIVLRFAQEANNFAKLTNDLDLRKEISEFLLTVHVSI